MNQMLVEYFSIEVWDELQKCLFLAATGIPFFVVITEEGADWLGLRGPCIFLARGPAIDVI